MIVTDALKGLSPEEKRRMLAERLAGGAAEPRSYPLSFAQQRLWFLDQLEPGSAAYNVPRALRLTGSLDRKALADALTEIVRRHESLRSVFEPRGDEVAQVVFPPSPVEVPVHDLEGETPKAREETALRIAGERARAPFDLGRGPLLRASLLPLGPREHILLLETHHIVSDAWSASILFDELAALYGAFASGNKSPLPELPLQYGEFSQWQRDWLQGEVLAEQLGYWRTQLAGAPESLNLPSDHPRPVLQTFRGAVEPIHVPREVRDRLAALSRRESATLFMTLLSAFAILLFRYTDEPDLVIGTPVANRSRTETERLIGFFVNTLPLRVDLSGNPSFRALVARVRETALGAYDHQDIPFEKLVEEIKPERDLSRNPIVQVMFSYQSAPLSLPRLAGLTSQRVDLPWNVSKFDLYVGFDDTPQGLSGGAEYNTDLFEPPMIARMAGHFVNLLSAIGEDPDRPISDLDVLSADEARRLVLDWNDTATAYPSSPIPEMFADRVARNPNATALRLQERNLTYSELDRKACQLAGRLREAGVGRGDRVAVGLERSFESVAALIGVLQVGAAYVPLDPSYPEDRLAFMLEDSRPLALVTSEARAGRLRPGRARVLLVDERNDDGAARGPAVAAAPLSPDDAAYVMYTSGSTGVPKGVVGLHRGIVNRLQWMWAKYPFRAGEVCCQKTSLSFVDSVSEIFGPLLAGVPTVLIPDDLVRDVPHLVRTLSRERVTRIVLVPALLRAVLEQDGDLGETLSALSLWVSSGESLERDVVERFHDRLPSATLLNLYGSSEASADSTAADTRERGGSGQVPIGRPIANHRVHLLGRYGRPIPAGVSGEIHLGGEGLARGYWNRPDLTAERFRPDPFGVQPGSRLYRTGDLGRYREDGTIEYLGRKDLQIKVRGHRIEPGEVEAALARHPRVGQAAVAAHRDASGENRLVAYVVPAGSEALPIQALRADLARTLPDAMIPSLFVSLTALPRTPSGKLDRAALPAPEAADRPREAPYEAPRTDLERTLCALWSELLGVDRVGIQDDFFALGGHSLLATRLVSRIRKQTRFDVPLRLVFEARTVAALALAISQRQAEALGSEDMARLLAEIQREGAAKGLPRSEKAAGS